MATCSRISSNQEYSTVKEFVDMRDSGNNNLPSIYITRNPASAALETIVKEEIPVIDFSLLMSENPSERSSIIGDIEKACKEWGCFTIVNHGVPESLQTAMMEAVYGFFNLTPEEKKEYADCKLFDPIRYATGFNSSMENVRYWRDFLRVIVHPTFNSPANPLNFSVISEEYARRLREMSLELLRALWESLGLSERGVEEALELKSCTQLLVNNFYPSCPQPELALGLPAHSDTSLLTLLMQSNTAACLQVMHDGKWVPVEPIPDSFFIHVGDHLEIVSNGIYKSVLHRVMLNNKSPRISVLSIIGTPLETVLAPLPQLVDLVNRPAAFRAITHKEFIKLHQLNQIEKLALNHIRL